MMINPQCPLCGFEMWFMKSKNLKFRVIRVFSCLEPRCKVCSLEVYA